MSGNLQACVTGRNEDVTPSWKNVSFILVIFHNVEMEYFSCDEVLLGFGFV